MQSNDIIISTLSVAGLCYTQISPCSLPLFEWAPTLSLAHLKCFSSLRAYYPLLSLFGLLLRTWSGLAWHERVSTAFACFIAEEPHDQNELASPAQIPIRQKEQNAALGASESIPTILERTAWGSERKTNGGRQAREWKSKEINVKEDFPWKWIKDGQWNGRSKVMRLMDIINSTFF